MNRRAFLALVGLSPLLAKLRPGMRKPEPKTYFEMAKLSDAEFEEFQAEWSKPADLVYFDDPWLPPGHPVMVKRQRLLNEYYNRAVSAWPAPASKKEKA